MQLFCEVGMYEDAVALALSFNRELATAIARRADSSEGQSRKLWLAIARHIIEQGAKPGAGDEVGRLVVRVRLQWDSWRPAWIHIRYSIGAG